MAEHATTLFCLAGTLVSTPGGPVPIDALVLGESLIVTADRLAQVTAIERISVEGPIGLGSALPLPVLIPAGSAGRGMPRRDLFVAPGAEVTWRGEVARLADLVADGSATQIAGAERLDFVCVAFDGAGFAFAEGVALRSTTTIDEVAQLRMAFADGPPIAAEAYDGVATSGIIARLETCTRDGVGGVAVSLSDPATPVVLEGVVDGVVVGVARADRDRVSSTAGQPATDASSSSPQIRHFWLGLPGVMRAGLHNVVQVRLAEGGQAIQGSPFLLSRTSWPPTRMQPMTQAAQRGTGFAGMLGIVSRRRIEGFAWSRATPQTPERIQILDNGRVIATVLANLKREDLLANGVGDGRHGFDVDIPAGLSPLQSHMIQVVRESDGAMLSGKPKVIPASDTFADEARQAILDAVGAIATVAELETALAFMADQTTRLLQQRADLTGERDARTAFVSFSRRWGPDPKGFDVEPMEKPSLRLLIIVKHLPRASSPHLSAQLRSHAAAMVSRDCEVDVVAAEDIAAASPLLHQTPLPGVSVCEAPYYGSAEEVLRRRAGCLDVVYVLGTEMPAFYLRLARRLNPRARIVFSPGHFTHVELMERASVESRPELARLGATRRFEELSAAAASDVVLVASAADHALIAKHLPNTIAKLIPVHSLQRRLDRPAAGRSGLALLAGRGDALDIDAAHHLIDDIMPLMWKVQPHMTCVLEFSEIPRWAKSLAGPQVAVRHRPSEDDASILAEAALTIAPYRFHAGLSPAILDSFAAGVPCLMSPAASEAFTLPSALQSLVCPSPQDYADRMVELHDGARHDAIVAAMMAMMSESFTQGLVASSLSKAILPS